MRSEEVRLERLPRLLAPRFFRSSAGFGKLLRQAGEQANRPRGARVIYTGAASGGGAREDFAPTLGLYGPGTVCQQSAAPTPSSTLSRAGVSWRLVPQRHRARHTAKRLALAAPNGCPAQRNRGQCTLDAIEQCDNGRRPKVPPQDRRSIMGPHLQRRHRSRHGRPGSRKYFIRHCR